MTGDIQFGGITLSALLTAVLALIYRVTGDRIPDRFRALIAAVIGVGLGLMNIPYQGLACSFPCLVDNSIYGLMIGLSSVGLYEIQRTVTKPR